MKITILSFFLFFVFKVAISQDYISYYNRCNDAVNYMVIHQYDSALVAFVEAFDMVDYVHKTYVNKACMCAAYEKDYDLLQEYSILSLQRGASFDYFNSEEYKRYRKTKQYKAVLANKVTYEQQFIESLNTDYIKAIDSLHYVDQKVIRGAGGDNSIYDLSKVMLPENKYELDSNNLAYLIGLIEQYGFPSEQLVGFDATNSAGIILHHNLRNPENAVLLNEFKKYIYTGEYVPSSYVGTYDQSLWFYYGSTIVGKVFKNSEYLSDKRLSVADSLANEMGLKPIEEAKIYIRESMLSFGSYW